MQEEKKKETEVGPHIFQGDQKMGSPRVPPSRLVPFTYQVYTVEKPIVYN